MDKNTDIHIGVELNIFSESVENVESKTEVNIQCCCNKVSGNRIKQVKVGYLYNLLVFL